MELSIIIISVVAGVFFGIPTGPARFFVVGSYLKKGRKAALKTYVGLFGSIFIYAGLALMASGFLSKNQQIENIFYLLGSLLLISWGIFLIIKGKKEGNNSIKVGNGSLYMKGFLTGISNPIGPFIYLAVIQFLKLYADSPALWQLLLYLMIFELSSCSTTFSISYLVNKKKGKMKNNWNAAKIAMGIFLVSAGIFNLFKVLDFKDGISFNKKEDVIEMPQK